MYRNVTVCPVDRQQGATLVVALIIVLVMGLTAASAMQNITLQEKMAGNMLDNSIAFHAAEDALFAAEQWIGATNPIPQANYNNAKPLQLSAYNGIANADAGNTALTEADLMSANSQVQANWEARAWDATAFGAAVNADLLQPVQVTIEQISTSEYLVLAHSRGASGNAEVILRAVVARL